MDRKNLVYYDDAGASWLAQNVAAILTNLGFDEYDPETNTDISPLPAGFRMRRVNLVFTTNAGRTRRTSYPCGSADHGVYKGVDTLTVKRPGIGAAGAPVATIDFVYKASSTRGEIRPFITVTDPGYTDLVANDNIVEIIPDAETP